MLRTNFRIASSFLLFSLSFVVHGIFTVLVLLFHGLFHLGSVLFGLLGAVVLCGVALDEWGVHRVERRVLLVLVTIAQVDLLPSAVAVEAVGAGPRQRPNNHHAVRLGLVSTIHVLGSVAHKTHSPRRLLQSLGHLDLAVLRNRVQQGSLGVSLEQLL